ncbi:MAG: SgcJ/EcaC family oxidoreductase [Gemmatimonadetes bacterium]|nr:SgcJ/EcaC family oxidoreductase [Gemmatimonadota bacterium]NIQ57824.1 SgcJ/EcaC family oxidoreductase [Gemmatimonadota bacterium]NIU77977.1 SgcJ/EcaC family oxidoreductase [Gammaproteobacteria bacterium]NIX47052.1 SgcJ/EcaC family oxidoreductase [Gemmatimonadota bacterium]NIY11430.1 SgcJ/EcaC family oxidoreductase [Gemmatimonadota bacterium]
MRHTDRIATGILASLLFIPGAVSGQAGMYGKEKDKLSRQAQMYEIAVRQGVNATLTEWREAWERDDAEALSRLYLEDATLYTETATIQGRDAIAEYFRRVLPLRSGRRSLPVSFDASGVLAFQVEETTVEFAEGEGRPRIRTQRELLVLRQQWDERWLIQSQHTTGIEDEAAR